MQSPIKSFCGILCALAPAKAAMMMPANVAVLAPANIAAGQTYSAASKIEPPAPAVRESSGPRQAEVAGGDSKKPASGCEASTGAVSQETSVAGRWGSRLEASKAEAVGPHIVFHGEVAWAAGPSERLVYENILGTELITFPTGQGADDLHLTAADGCLLSRLEFQVSGGAGESAPFSVSFALHEDCPGVLGPIIPGTEGQIDLPDNGPYWVTFEPPPQTQVAIPNRAWLQLTFSRPDAGWIGGAPALEGFTDPVYLNPFLGGCDASLGVNFPETPYSGLNARIFVREPCQPSFLGFRAGPPVLFPFSIGNVVRVAEDMELSVDGCELRSYELAIRTEGTLEVDLRTPDPLNQNLPGALIPGSSAQFATASNLPRIARARFDPPVHIPKRLWITMRVAAGAARSSLVRAPPAAGATDETYAVLGKDGWAYQSIVNTPGPAAFFVSLTCAGEAPRGACCDMFQPDESGEAVCREVPEINCPYPPRGSSLLPRWQSGAVCDPDPFSPPCGTAACCRGDGECEDVTERDCNRNRVSWTQGVYCENLVKPCEHICVSSFDSCTLAHDGIGCKDPFCCREVCRQTGQDFCCIVTWDEECVAVAAVVCDIPPANDACAPSGELFGAKPITMPGSASSDGVHATESPDDPGFCCNEALPGAPGLGTVWYRFVATGPTAEFTTCRSSLPATDSMIQVFEVGDASSTEAACATLQPIGCNDNNTPCGRPGNSRLCLNNLIVGQTYYVLVAAKTQAARGNYILDINTFCQSAPPQTCPCPVGEVGWIDPPNGVVDARRPHPANNAAVAEGIRIFAAAVPLGSDRPECWFVCDSPGSLPENGIAQVFRGTGGVGSIILDRPMALGEATVISYVDAFMSPNAGTFISHPGNVNGDAFTDVDDVIRLLEILGGQAFAPWGPYSADLDRSGRVGPLDVLEEMNLLNGAEQFGVWEGTPRPAPAMSCP